MASGTRVAGVGSDGSGRAAWFAVLVVLVALFGGLSTVFAQRAQADSHNAVITVDCDSWEIELSGYSDMSSISYFVTSGGRGPITDGEEFDGSFSESGSLDPTLVQSIGIFVFDPLDQNADRGWSFRQVEISPVCEETTTTTVAPVTTTTSVGASTLPFTGAGSVLSALLAVVLFGSGALVLLFAPS